MGNLITTVNAWMVDRGWNQAELARRMGRTTGAVSLVLSGRRGVGPDFLTDLARVFDRPVAEVFRLAGLLPEDAASDPLLERVEYLFNSLKDPADKIKAAEFLEFLKQKEKKGS